MSGAFRDGGIRTASIDFHPSWRTLDYDSWITHRLHFYTCNTIPAGGAITVTIPFSATTYYADASSDCKIYKGLTSDNDQLNQVMTCTRSAGQYLIKDFNEVGAYTLVSVIVYLKSKTVSTSPTNWAIQSWLDKTQPFTAHSDNAAVRNEIDYYSSFSGNVETKGITPPALVGPK